MSRTIQLVAGLATVSAFSGGPPMPDTVAKCLNAPAAALAPKCEEALEQSPAEVTMGAVGLRDPTGTLIHDYQDAGLCQVNVHWHLGAEHMSEGQYDVKVTTDGHRRLLADEVEAHHDVTPGWMCRDHDTTNPMYTKEYDWKYCSGMEVGKTYEVHWPYSSAGLGCITGKTSLSDGLGGVFCMSHSPTGIGVQGQVYVIVNDDAFDVEDLTFGMNMTMATNVAKYTGSTTGGSYDNMACSPYAPISWHVDRDCHKVSAKSFDLMCKTMQGFGMVKDLEPHSSRELVDPEWVTSMPMTR